MQEQKIRSCNTKTLKSASGLYITKIRNVETRQILVTAAYKTLAIVIDSAQNVLDWYEGAQAQCQYLKYTGKAVTQKFDKEEKNIPVEIKAFADDIYFAAMDMR